MVDVQRGHGITRVSGIETPPLEQQIEHAKRGAERERAYWHGQVQKRLANEVHAAQRIRLAESVVESLQQLLSILGPTRGLMPPSSPCRSCAAPIVWLKTASGKSMPVDAPSVQAGDTTFDASRHVTHFSTCPNADQHRKPAHGGD